MLDLLINLQVHYLCQTCCWNQVHSELKNKNDFVWSPTLKSGFMRSEKEGLACNDWRRRFLRELFHRNTKLLNFLFRLRLQLNQHFQQTNTARILSK